MDSISFTAMITGIYAPKIRSSVDPDIPGRNIAEIAAISLIFLDFHKELKAVCIFSMDMATHGFYQIFGDIQAKPVPFLLISGFIDTVKFVKKIRRFVFRYTHCVCSYFY